MKNNNAIVQNLFSPVHQKIKDLERSYSSMQQRNDLNLDIKQMRKTRDHAKNILKQNRYNTQRYPPTQYSYNYTQPQQIGINQMIYRQPQQLQTDRLFKTQFKSAGYLTPHNLSAQRQTSTTDKSFTLLQNPQVYNSFKNKKEKLLSRHKSEAFLKTTNQKVKPTKTLNQVSRPTPKKLPEQNFQLYHLSENKILAKEKTPYIKEQLMSAQSSDKIPKSLSVNPVINKMTLGYLQKTQQNGVDVETKKQTIVNECKILISKNQSLENKCMLLHQTMNDLTNQINQLSARDQSKISSKRKLRQQISGSIQILRKLKKESQIFHPILKQLQIEFQNNIEQVLNVKNENLVLKYKLKTANENQQFLEKQSTIYNKSQPQKASNNQQKTALSLLNHNAKELTNLKEILFDKYQEILQLKEEMRKVKLQTNLSQNNLVIKEQQKLNNIQEFYTLTKKYEELKSKFSEFKALGYQTKSLQSQIEEIQKSLEQQNKKINILQIRTFNIANQNDNINYKSTDFSDVNHSLKQSQVNKNTEVYQMKEKLQFLESQNEDQKILLFKLAEKNEILEDNMQIFNSNNNEISLLKSYKEELGNRLDCDIQAKKLIQENTKLEIDHYELLERFNECTQKIEQLKNKNYLLVQQLNESKLDNQEMIQSVVKNEDYYKNLDNQVTEVQSLEEQQEIDKAQIVSLTEKISQLEVKISEQQVEIEKGQQLNNDQSNTLKNTQLELKNIKLENDQLKESVISKDQELKQLTDSLKKMKLQIKKLTDQLKKMELQVKKLTNKETSQRDSQKKLSDIITFLKEFISDLKIKLANKEEQSIENQNIIKAQKKHIRKLKKLLDSTSSILQQSLQFKNENEEEIVFEQQIKQKEKGIKNEKEPFEEILFKQSRMIQNLLIDKVDHQSGNNKGAYIQQLEISKQGIKQEQLSQKEDQQKPLQLIEKQQTKETPKEKRNSQINNILFKYASKQDKNEQLNDMTEEKKIVKLHQSYFYYYFQKKFMEQINASDIANQTNPQATNEFDEKTWQIHQDNKDLITIEIQNSEPQQVTNSQFYRNSVQSTIRKQSLGQSINSVDFTDNRDITNPQNMEYYDDLAQNLINDMENFIKQKKT